MIEQEYRREMEQIALEAETMERIVRAMTEEKQKKRRRLPAGRLLAAAAACVVLTTSVLAASPTLRERLERLLGGFASYSQSFDDTAVTDQGVTMRLVSAIADQGTVQLFLEFSGEMGGLLTVGDKGPIQGFLRWEADEPIPSVFSYQCVDQDLEKGISLVEVKRWDEELHQDGVMTLTVDRICPERREQESEDCWIDFSDAGEVEWETLETGEIVLKPGQDGRGVPGMEDVTISSVGFAGDGLLHVLYQIPEEAVLAESHVLSQLRRDGTEEGDAVYGFQEGQEFFQDVLFERNGRGYIDQRYCITPEEIQGWGIEAVVMHYATVPHIEGNWDLTFQVEQLPVQEIQLSGETDWNAEWKVQSLMLTPWSIRLVGTAPYYRSYPCSVTQKDGTTLTLELERAFITWPDEVGGISRWEFDQPVESGSIASVQIGDWTIRLEGNVGIVERP